MATAFTKAVFLLANAIKDNAPALTKAIQDLTKAIENKQLDSKAENFEEAWAKKGIKVGDYLLNTQTNYVCKVNKINDKGEADLHTVDDIYLYPITDGHVGTTHQKISVFPIPMSLIQKGNQILLPEATKAVRIFDVVSSVDEAKTTLFLEVNGESKTVVYSLTDYAHILYST